MPNDNVNSRAPALSRPTVVVDTTDAYSFMAAVKTLEKGGISFRAEKEYTADLVEGRSFLGPYAWKIVVEAEQQQDACRLIEDSGVCVAIDVPDEEDSTTVDPEEQQRSFWLLLFYGGLLLLGLGMLVKRLMD